MIDTHIVVLTYNRLNALQRCINSIRNSKSIPNSIIVVDNSSNNETADWAKLQRDITYLTGDNNLGVIARNIGFEKAGEGIIVQVDDDAWVDPNWNDTIQKWFSRPEVGAIGQDAWFRDGWLGFKGGVEVGQECDFATGYIWAFRNKKNWRYDENLKPFWREESDLALNIKYDGYKIYRCENLGGHVSHRTGEVDWEVHNRNHQYVIDKWKNKFENMTTYKLIKDANKIRFEEVNKSAKVLFVLGGLRIGDCFHVTPIINELKQKYEDITWVAGTYEQEVVKYLSSVYNLKYVLVDDAFPMDLNSRENFAKQASTQVKFEDYDIVVNDFCGSFDVGPSLKIYSQLPDLETSDPIKEPYIVIHNYSYSVGKDFPFLNYLRYPCKVVCVGGAKDPLPKGFIDYRGKDLKEVYQLIKHCKLFIGIHSAMACFSFYIPKVKGVVCHFAEGGLVNFSEYRKDWIELKPNECTADKILEIIKSI